MPRLIRWVIQQAWISSYDDHTSWQPQLLRSCGRVAFQLFEGFRWASPGTEFVSSVQEWSRQSSQRLACITFGSVGRMSATATHLDSKIPELSQRLQVPQVLILQAYKVDPAQALQAGEVLKALHAGIAQLIAKDDLQLCQRGQLLQELWNCANLLARRSECSARQVGT